MYNYFKEVNPLWDTPNFDLNHRTDPDMASKQLIVDLAGQFLNNRETPSGNILKSVGCYQTRDKYKRWYAKVQVFSPHNDYIASFGITSDYIGASVNWALRAGVANDVILEHLSISRILAGHIVFPTWYSKPTEKSWDVYPEGLSINTRRGGRLGYCDRIDCTLLAIKRWYSNQDSQLSETIDKNREWFQLFSDFKQYAEFFCLSSIVTGDDIFDLTSYNSKSCSYDRVLENDTNNIALPQDNNNYVRYIKGCERFILQRRSLLDTNWHSEEKICTCTKKLLLP